jgi:hypothetical protein
MQSGDDAKHGKPYPKTTSSSEFWDDKPIARYQPPTNSQKPNSRHVHTRNPHAKIRRQEQKQNKKLQQNKIARRSRPEGLIEKTARL